MIVTQANCLLLNFHLSLGEEKLQTRTQIFALSMQIIVYKLLAESAAFVSDFSDYFLVVCCFPTPSIRHSNSNNGRKYFSYFLFAFFSRCFAAHRPDERCAKYSIQFFPQFEFMPDEQINRRALGMPNREEESFKLNFSLSRARIEIKTALRIPIAVFASQSADFHVFFP